MALYLEKEKTTSTPYLLIDEKNGYMKLEGRSFHESITEFFKEVFNWLDVYLKTDFGSFTFDLEMDYFNSATSKLLHNMLMKMDCYTTDKNSITVNWITTEDNDIIIECGEDLLDEVEKLTFNMVIK
ncbi:MAG: DUF1987 domain-containing protein [Treponema sp.]|nr:DUF1987 domain-containing protein [Treponema sp.]